MAPAPLAAQNAPAPAPANDVDRAVDALRAITTMRANFVQTDRSGQSLSGVMTMKRPGKIRFQYERGVPLLIVSDGRALTLIDYEVRQVQRWPIRNSPLGALLDPSKDVARFARLIPTNHSSVVSIEVRDTRHPEYGTITLIFIRLPRRADSNSTAGLRSIRRTSEPPCACRASNTASMCRKTRSAGTIRVPTRPSTDTVCPRSRRPVLYRTGLPAVRRRHAALRQQPVRGTRQAATNLSFPFIRQQARRS
jgi:hypothetical protein